ncbi:uncharacterized protein HKW66_Vig0099900 [Vigna angularis]|uniref:IPO4/5-like TPR repeats domain-containing protein n=1 Tax=Phaseolus angularis TaxID=3914 RepID=A0A8T0KKB6_PHAAN|nr:uncharacterized protein LOC108321792 [Vigna angularis]KAG2400156.1 uncharacterized protein HKW66_Vig0099900 [Vigna angularis]
MANDPRQNEAQVTLILGPDSTHLESLISHLMSFSNDQRSQLESLFNLCKQTRPESLLLGLAHILHTAPKPETRTMSAILLRRHFTHHHDSFLWPLLSPAARSSLHFVLLSSLQQEPIKSIPKKLYDTISELTATILPDDPSTWSDLLPLLFQWVTSPEPRLQEVSLMIFAQLAHYIGQTILPQLSTFHSVL